MRQNLTQMFSDVSIRSMKTIGGKKTKEMVVSKLKDKKTGSIFTISGATTGSSVMSFRISYVLILLIGY